MARQRDQSKIENIHQAAMQLVIRHGFNGFIMADVAKAAGVATGTLYIYFKNKEDLVNAIFIETKKKIAEVLNIDISQLDYKTAFEKAWMAYFNYCYVHPDHMLFVEQFLHSGFLSDESKQYAKDCFKNLDNFILLGQENDQIRKVNTEVLKAQIMGAIHEFIKLNLEQPGTLDAVTLETCRDMAWNSIKQ